MKIVLIMPDYFPKQNPRVFRWQALAEHWSYKGFDVSILCASHSLHPPNEVINGVNVYRVGQGSMMDWLNNIFDSKIRRRENSDKHDNTVKLNHLTRLSFFHKLWTKIYWPDGACIWVYPAKKMAVKLVKQINPDVIISISLPFSSHLVGKYCKKHFPNIPWIVDIGDPFSILDTFPKNNLILYKRLNLKVERLVFSKANVICVTEHGAMEAYKKYFPEFFKKIKVIPPLFNEAKKDIVLPLLNFDSLKINIAYFGSFYTGIRPPDVVIDLVQKLLQFKQDFKDKFAVHFFGYIEPEFIAVFKRYSELEDCIILHGQIDKPEVMPIVHQCDFLLNIGNKTTYQLPSKSVDYMMSGKPIVNICLQKDDTFARFFEDYPFIFNVIYNQENFNEKQINDLLEFFQHTKGNKLGKEWLAEKGRQFGVENIAYKYEKLFM